MLLYITTTTTNFSILLPQLQFYTTTLHLCLLPNSKKVVYTTLLLNTYRCTTAILAYYYSPGQRCRGPGAKYDKSVFVCVCVCVWSAGQRSGGTKARRGGGPAAAQRRCARTETHLLPPYYRKRQEAGNLWVGSATSSGIDKRLKSRWDNNPSRFFQVRARAHISRDQG